jgi:hypothetical protein
MAPSFRSFGQVLSEEKNLKNQPIRNKGHLWWPCLLSDHDEMSNHYRRPSIDASYQVSVHFLAKGNVSFCHHLASIVCRQLTFHILIFSSETPQPNELKRKDFITEMEIEGYRWQDLERMAQNRTRWRTVVSGLCTTKVQQA